METLIVAGIVADTYIGLVSVIVNWQLPKEIVVGMDYEEKGGLSLWLNNVNVEDAHPNTPPNMRKGKVLG